jgi:glutamate-1-semialdehyde 2,1-aminomutase
MDAAQGSFISSTNWTERTGFTAALATIRKHQATNASRHLIEIGQAIQAGWASLGARHEIPITVGGIPPLSHFSFETAAPLVAKAFFIQEMLAHGFLASTSLYSMLAHTTDHVALYLTAADEVFARLATALQNDTLHKQLRGAPSAPGFTRLA